MIARIATELEIPRRLRALVRARESSLIGLAALVGVIAGLVGRRHGRSRSICSTNCFSICSTASACRRGLTLNPVLALSVPLVGGLIFGIASELIRRWRPEREIDPIEANALHGGRMSLLGSIIVAAQTVWSSGVGASVGLEAGYTQIASGIASRIGNAFRLRRGDLRILVGCGAAAGIAGAFGAPLAGAFYGFELIIGSYSPSSLAPVGISALIGFLVARSLAPAELGVVAPEKMTIAVHDLVLAATLGLLAAMLGILLMRGVALSETHVRAPAAAADAAHHGRRPRRRAVGDHVAADDVVGSWRVARRRHARFVVSRRRAACSCSRSWPRSRRSAPDFAAGCFSLRS